MGVYQAGYDHIPLGVDHGIGGCPVCTDFFKTALFNKKGVRPDNRGIDITADQGPDILYQNR